MICKICNLEINSYSHLKKHNITSKDYYDTFLKMDNEGICYCGNDTAFIS